MKTTKISLNKIIMDDDIFPRESEDQDYINELAEVITDGAKIPPVTVFERIKFYLADGFHRCKAFKKAEVDKIKIEIREGGKRKAILFACGANAEHGRRRTNEDKRFVVFKLLKDKKWNLWSDGKIAKHCRVSQAFASKLRRELTQNGFESPLNRVGDDGRTYNTEKIGGSRPHGETDPLKGTDTYKGNTEGSFSSLSNLPLPVSGLNPEDGVDSMPDNTPETDSMDSDSQPENDNDSDTDTDEEQDKPISSPEQIEKLGEQITNVTTKLSKIKAVFENQSVLTKSKMKRLGKLKEDLQKAWIKFSFELDSLIRS